MRHGDLVDGVSSHRVWDWLSGWWGDVELWLAQLWFPFQFALVMAVLLPVCLGIAWLIDRVTGFASTKLAQSKLAQSKLGQSKLAQPGEKHHDE